MNEILNNIGTVIVTYGLKVLGAIVILLVGRWLARFLAAATGKALSKTSLNVTLVRFVTNLVNAGIIVFSVIAALNQIGIQNTSIVALLGAAGLAIGLALEGALANFAAGALILMFNPFKVGDRVEAGGVFGIVDEIQIFNTVLVTLDNKTVIIPNSQITGGTITNYSKRGMIRIEIIIGIGYNDNLKQAKQIIEEILATQPLVLPDPKFTVAVHELAESSVNLTVRSYVRPEDDPRARFMIIEQIKLRFDEQGISFPYPQREVHLFSKN